MILLPDGGEGLVRDAGNRAVRALALETLSRLVQKTPVDTGRARGNWNVALDAVDGSVSEGNNDRGGGATIARGGAQMAGADVWGGQAIVIANGVDYVVQLEHGSSRQAPSGMVAVTVGEMRAAAGSLISAEVRG